MSNAMNETIHSVQIAKPAHFTISVELDGFPVTVEAEGKAENLRAIVDRLKAIGAKPPATAASAARIGEACRCAGVPDPQRADEGQPEARLLLLSQTDG